MTTLAEVAVRFKGDLSQLLRDAQQEGSKAGDTAGASFAERFSPAIGKLAFAGFATGAAIAVRGLVDLDTATQNYRATTGATQADIDKMQATVLDLNRHNLDNIDQITSVLTVLRTDMGLTQDEADALAQSFLSYAKVTKQDGVGATKAFDDILDAWGLKASDSAGIMDQLVVSHQRYGGSIEENQQALTTLAPQLKALNVDVDGAIGLLNLFAASGIDSSKATAALNTAVAKLKPGQSLDDLIAKITAIEDPTLRAKAAIDTFGARGGVALANALKPGVTGLKDFEVSAGEASGAVKKASDEIDSSLTGRAQLALKDFGGALLQLMAQGGPVLQFAAIGAPLVVGGIQSISAALGAASAGAALKWAALLGPVAVLAGTTVVALGEIDKARNADTASLEAAANKQGGMYGAMARQALQHREAVEATSAAVDIAVEGMAEHVAEGGRSIGGSWGEMADKVRAGGAAVVQSGTDMDDALLGQFKGIQEQARYTGERIPSNFAAGIKATRQQPLDEFNTLVEMLKHPMTTATEIARLTGELTSKNLAAGLKSGDPEVQAQAETTRDTIIDRLQQLVPAGGRVSKNAMDDLAAGMKSKDPTVRAAAEGIYETVKATLALSDSKLWAQHAAEAYAEGFASRQQYLAEKTRVFLAGASRQMIAASPPKEGPLKDIDKWGQRTGSAWVDSFADALAAAGPKARASLAGIRLEPTWNAGTPATPSMPTAAPWSPHGVYATPSIAAGPAQGLAGAGHQLHVTINNPAPEPAGQSATRTLQLLADQLHG